VDGHASAQEKGLEAALIYLENSSLGPRLVGDMMSGVIAKCLTSTRARVKELGVSIVMMCVEIEKQEMVQDELTKGMDLKNPKVVAACITVFTQAIKYDLFFCIFLLIIPISKMSSHALLILESSVLRFSKQSSLPRNSLPSWRIETRVFEMRARRWRLHYGIGLDQRLEKTLVPSNQLW